MTARRVAAAGRIVGTLAVSAWLAGALAPPGARAQVLLRTESDRAALRQWFLLLADAQFYRPTSDVTDCAALVRHALREALRPHTPEWLRQARLPLAQLAPEIEDRPRAAVDALLLFLVSERPPRYAEFADARTIVQLNARAVGRTLEAARPGDLLYFHRPGHPLPDHLMVFLGPSPLAPEASDWIVYHTGPDAAAASAGGQQARSPRPAIANGEVRKVRAEDLQRHPSPWWRPTPSNPAFVGVFRLHLLW